MVHKKKSDLTCYPVLAQKIGSSNRKQRDGKRCPPWGIGGEIVVDGVVLVNPETNRTGPESEWRVDIQTSVMKGIDQRAPFIQLKERGGSSRNAATNGTWPGGGKAGR